MLIDLKACIHAQDSDETIIKDKDQMLPSLKDVLLYALRHIIQSDQATDYVEKAKRYSFIKRMKDVDTIELTKPEVEILKDRVGKVYLQVEVIGQVAELLETPYVAPPVEPVKSPIPMMEGAPPSPDEKKN